MIRLKKEINKKMDISKVYQSNLFVSEFVHLDVRKYIGNFTQKKFFLEVDEKSMRRFLKELSKEPHIAAGRRDK